MAARGRAGGECPLVVLEKPDEGMSEGCGIAADGLVAATASPGPVLSLVLDPKIKRMDATDLQRHVTSAFNLALDDLRAKLLQGEGSLPDLAVLTTMLQDVQQQVAGTLTTIGERINAAMAAAGQSARLDVGATVEPSLNLLDHAREAVEMAQGGGTADPDVRGHGTALDDRVRSVAVIGRVEAVEIGRGAMNLPAVELADGLAEAATEALRDVLANRKASGQVDRTELRARTREVRELGVQNMRSYADAMSDLIARLDVSGGRE